MIIKKLFAMISIIYCSCAAPKAYMPLTGGGPFLNIGANDQARSNASAHLAWSITFPLAGFAAFGRKGGCIGAGGWILESVIGEAFFHAPPNPDGDYASEVRTDLVTKSAVPLGWLIVEAFRNNTCGIGENK